MARFKQHVAGKGGWSDWETPVMRRYKMACCDCGLVHDLDFQALEVTKRSRAGTWIASVLPVGKYRVRFRARRNARSTAMIRRWKKAKEQ